MDAQSVVSLELTSERKRGTVYTGRAVDCAPEVVVVKSQISQRKRSPFQMREKFPAESIDLLRVMIHIQMK